jgi:hypothetical protein
LPATRSVGYCRRVAYHVRVLSVAALPVPLESLREALAAEGLDAVLVGDEGGYWANVILTRPSGDEIAAIHRRPVDAGEVGEEELLALVEEARSGRPASTARWVEGFLGTVRTIYAIRVLRGADAEGGWDAIHAVRGALWRAAEAILHADAWGFSNTAGDHVLWRCLDFETGDRQMAVLDERGRWRRFVMDLGNEAHRAAFLQGTVPDGARPVV